MGHCCCTLEQGWQFEESPGNVTSSLGKPVRLRCGIRGFGEPPEIIWTRDGEPLEMSDTNQLTLHLGEEEEEKWLSVSELWISSVQLSDMGGYRCALTEEGGELLSEEGYLELEGRDSQQDSRISSVQLSDMGGYRCALTEEGGELLSEEGYLELEGLPHFSEEPRDFAVVANRTLNLSCRAHGPPEPVRVIWLQDGAPLNTLLDPVALSPSTLTLRGLNRSSSFSCEAHNKKGVATSTTGTVTGLNRSSSFSCEAHNKKGVATSTTGTVTVIPDKPQKLKLYSRTNRSLEVSWEPGFGGVYPITVYSIQVSEPTGGHMIYNQNVNATSLSHVIPGLVPFTEYRVRLSCRSSEGVSDWTDWVTMATLEGVPSLAPTNVSVQFNGSLALVKWEEPAGRLNGVLRGYRLAYRSQEPGEPVNTLGISDDLKEKLQDVMVDRHRLTLGKTLGEGEFGSVMEGQLSQEDYVLKVAVKTMKSEEAPALL
ncbi:UNVERIFIED_CONTAM: hypothetical protein FKN15_010017 [Acipenser sinensis]